MQLGAILLSLGMLMIGVSIYYFKRNNLLIPSVLLTFIHLFVIWGIYEITGSIAYGFIAMVVYTFYFGYEVIMYVLKNRDVNEIEKRLKELVEEEFEFFYKAVKEDVDEDEFFKHVLRFDEMYEVALKYDLTHTVEPLMRFIKFYLPSLRRYRISQKSRRFNIPKTKWWFYMDEIVLQR